jgi:hypothetical protein
MLVSIVGHAIFHTAGPNGPSTMERSYRLFPGAAGGTWASDGCACVTGAETSVMRAPVTYSSNGLSPDRQGGRFYPGNIFSSALGP